MSETSVRVIADRFCLKRVKKKRFAFYDIQSYEIKEMKEFVERKNSGNKRRNK